MRSAMNMIISVEQITKAVQLSWNIKWMLRIRGSMRDNISSDWRYVDNGPATGSRIGTAPIVTTFIGSHEAHSTLDHTDNAEMKEQRVCEGLGRRWVNAEWFRESCSSAVKQRVKKKKKKSNASREWCGHTNK